MDKKLILAVAGSGKTTYIIKNLNLERRFLILTFTNNNFYNLRTKIIQKFGFLPENIKIFTYFSFLYSFCFKPFLLTKTGVRGINFNPCHNYRAVGFQRYVDSDKRVYSNRLAKFIVDRGAIDDVEKRLKKYFDVIMIDEIQDFAGNDFNFLPHIVNSVDDFLFVGDFYQHTFDTSRDGNINKSLHDEYGAYIKRFTDMGLKPDTETLSHSHRCSPSICTFISDHLDIEISSHRNDSTAIHFIATADEASPIFHDNDIVKLFYQKSRKYPCFARNWGESKGDDRYQDVCVVLNENTLKHFKIERLTDLPAQTKNKLYVAVTRTRGSLYLVSDTTIRQVVKEETYVGI